MPLAFVFAVSLVLTTPSASLPPARDLAVQQDSGAPQSTTQNPPAEQPVPQIPQTPEKPNEPGSTTSTPLAKPCADNTKSTSQASSGDCTTAGKAKPKKHKARSTGTAASGPTKTVVRQGSTPDPSVQIAPRLSQQQASHELQDTNQLLSAADTNLKKLSTRQLSAGQQDTVGQIRNYMQQAKTAIDNGELERARNLALKAKLLSADLAGH